MEPPRRSATAFSGVTYGLDTDAGPAAAWPDRAEAAGRTFARMLAAIASRAPSAEAPETVAGLSGPGECERVLAHSLRLASSGARGRLSMRTMGRLLDAFGRALLDPGRATPDCRTETARAGTAAGPTQAAETTYLAALEAGAAAGMREAGLEFEASAPVCAWMADARLTLEMRASFGSRRTLGSP